MAKAYELLSANIRERLQELKLSQSELARRAGVTPAYVSQVVNGQNESPGLAQIEAIAKALGTTPSKLLAGPDDRPSVMESLRAARRLLQDLENGDADSLLVKDYVSPKKPPKK